MKDVYVSAEDARAGADPQWGDTGATHRFRRVHDWRSHVPDEVRLIWHTFSPEQRTALVNWADDLASSEIWD